MTYLIRTADTSDAAVIAHHRRAMFEEMQIKGAMDMMEFAFRDWVAGQIERELYRGWFVITETNEVVAGAGARLIEWAPTPAFPRTHTQPYILNVYVEPPHRRRGLARMLMETIIAWGQEQGHPTLALHASEFGRPLYEQLGFYGTNEMRLHLHL